ncbi:hypothetical protein GCM10027422_48730 [Hymenobacter arcticus]
MGVSRSGYYLGRCALRSWLRASGQRALSAHAKQADPAAVVAENRLQGQLAPKRPNQVWVGYSTYLPLVGGRWCYLATWRAACSRRMVGWHLATHMPTDLVIRALKQVLTLRQPAPGLVIHAGRGSQSTSHACRQRLEDTGSLTSYARPGNPYDNAEAGWNTLKTELLPHGWAFANLEEARLEVAYYLDTYFNLDHRHAALGYRSLHRVESMQNTWPSVTPPWATARPISLKLTYYLLPTLAHCPFPLDHPKRHAGCGFAPEQTNWKVRSYGLG